MMSTALASPKRSRRDKPSFDVTWVLAAKAGFVLAFDELVTRNEKRVYRFAFNATQNQKDAEDVMQSAFIEAYEHLHALRDDSRFSRWVLRMAANQALHKLREKYPEECAVGQFPEPGCTSLPRNLADWSDDPAQGYTTRELGRILSEGIGTLKPISRIVFSLRDVEKCSVEEVADYLGLSLPDIRSHLLRARLEMREYLNSYFGSRSDSAPRHTRLEGREQKEADNERTIGSPAT